MDLSLPGDAGLTGGTRGVAPRVEGVTAGMPRLLDPKTGRPIENEPVTADSSRQIEGIPERPAMEEFGFDPANIRDISEPQRTTLAELDALALESHDIFRRILHEQARSSGYRQRNAHRGWFI